VVNEDAADAAGGNGNRQLRVNRVRVRAFFLIRELQRLAGARIVDLDVGPFAAAARRVHELGRADARFFGQEPDPELLAAWREDGVLRVRVLREELRDRARRPERSVGIGPPREWVVGAAPTLRDE